MMFYPERMKSVDIIVENSRLDHLLKALHRVGIMEISEVQNTDKEYINMIKKSRPPTDLREISLLLIRIEEILSDFQLAGGGGRKGIREMIFPEPLEKVRTERKGAEKLKKEAEALLSRVEGRVRELSREMNSINESIIRKKSQLEDLQKIKSMDMDLSLLGKGEYVVIRAGEIRDLSTFVSGISEIKTAFYEHVLFFKRKKIERYAVVVACYIKDEERLNAVLRKSGFQEFDFEGVEGLPEEAERSIGREIAGLEKELESLRKDMEKLASRWRKKVLVLEEELEIERERIDIISSMGRTDSVHIITGWVSEKDADKLEKIARKYTDNHAIVFFREPEKAENVPTKMKNSGWAKPFEFLTKMFATPKYNEIDPTMIIAPIFIIYFGLMLGDALYGVIITTGGLIIFRGIGRIDEGARHFGMVIILAGISTVIFGILQGGYLGPFSDQAYNLPQIFGIETKPLLDSMKDPITMLVIGLIIGLFHLNLGLFLGALQNIGQGRKKEVLLQQGTWWLLQPGAFILIAGKLFRWYDYSGEIYILAWILVITGIIMLIIEEKGLFFFGITGFLGNFLSYARILALGLGTAGIALTVNIMSSLVLGGASMISEPVCGAVAVLGIGFGVFGIKKSRKRYKIIGAFFMVFGFVGFLSVPAAFILMASLVFIAGHMVNTALQALGSFVHSLRLQYVEFFGYFYEGGGREFQPYEEKRRITEVKEVYE